MTQALQLAESSERRAIVTPFGIRFWDPALDNQVQDGLTVTARPLEGGKTTIGQRTASGIYAFHRLPGLHDWEYPAAETGIDGSPPVRRRFIVQVVDNRQRFLAVVFSVDLPFSGVYPTAASANSGNRLPGFFLFSAPTRPGMPTLAVVRAQLIERTDSTIAKPAANAVLEIQEPNNRIWYGIADERGSVAVFFPYPTFTGAASGLLSPPPAERRQQWRLRIRVRYAPAQVTTPPGSVLPELGGILSQARGVIWASPAGSVNRLATTLSFGEESLLRTATQSALWIQPS